MSDIYYVQFRPDGQVRSYKNKRPPVNLGPAIEVTPAIEKKMKGVPYSRWQLSPMGVLSARESSVKLTATLLREEDKVPSAPSNVVTPLLLPHEVKKQITLLPLMFGSAILGVAAGYLIKLLVF